MDKNSLNFRVIEKQVKNLQKILFSLPYAILAKYDISCSLWTYLTFKGPLFLVQDKQKQKKLIILNQCQVKNYILSIQHFQKFQLQTIKDNGGYMLNWMFEDSIQGLQICGIWTSDQKIKRIQQIIKQQ